MKKKTTKWRGKFLGAVLGLSLVLSGPSLTVYGEGQTYTVTYSPGKIGVFTDAYYAELESRYAQSPETSVSRSGKTGNIKIQLPAQSPYPRAPRPEDIQLKEAYEGKYVVDPAWMPQEEYVTSSESYVVDYDALVDAVTYRIEFVDAESGNQVASPVIAQGNAEQVISYTAQRVEDYVVSGERNQSLILGKNKDNVITFQYTSALEPVVTDGGVVVVEENVPGDTVTVTEDRPAAQTGGTGTGAAQTGTGAAAGTVQAGAGTAPGGAQAGAGAAQETGGQPGEAQEATIEGENVPLAGTPDLESAEREGQEKETEIEEEETPLAELAEEEETEEEETKKEGAGTLPFVIGILALLVLLGAGTYFVKRKK